MKDRDTDGGSASFHTESDAKGKKARATSFAVYMLLGSLLWAVWNESAAPYVFLQGALLTWLAIAVTSRHFLKADYPEVFAISPLTFLRYVAVLILAIFQSGFHAIYITLTGRMRLGVMDLPTGITDPFRGVLVANAITLTPGTVTIEHAEGHFKVVWIECLTDNPQEAGDMIKGRFERVFLAPDRRGRPAG